jgi:hypothetical protein
VRFKLVLLGCVLLGALKGDQPLPAGQVARAVLHAVLPEIGVGRGKGASLRVESGAGTHGVDRGAGSAVLLVPVAHAFVGERSRIITGQHGRHIRRERYCRLSTR